jgi:ribosomal protein L24
LLETIKGAEGKVLRVDREKNKAIVEGKHGFKTYETKCKSPVVL